MTAAGADLTSLDEQICFALYSASRALTARYRDLLAPLGLTYPQYLVLLILWNEGESSVGHLGERLHLDSGTLSPLLRRLEQAGHVVRSRSTADERTVLVALTPQGSALRAEAAGIPERICAATGLDLQGLSALREQIDALAVHARATD
ncbi:Organic hydroperoxide resistance transcriptional regulator [Frondihabitans sp. 762G35]|uniref:MarR family winged helix-turn-helix transcriptional regulator n=1 Tax=Frondihabitans sp. 762G35 TaxID=1446794 RepID=UPI000D2002B1|nr:MarR family transcriptional regulator [Frondihabitans sp. 762G35]ARC56075.1 Organic hydroperoxide resistance transcriptional regulator [Frondihabitans sp. 762G35]